MNLKTQKRIAAQLLKVGKNRVWFDEKRLSEIKEAITKFDIKSLIKNLAIQAKPVKGGSRSRVRKAKIQKRKGRQKGIGSRKGKRTARFSRKQAWINKVRVQREFISLLKEKNLVTPRTYRMLYKKIKGDFFRSKRHIRLYLKENNLIRSKK